MKMMLAAGFRNFAAARLNCYVHFLTVSCAAFSLCGQKIASVIHYS